MPAGPMSKNVDALVVTGITKYFHLPQPPLLKRLLGIKTELPQPGIELTLKAGDKQPVIAVDHVTFNIKRGEIFGVLGPNGSGKSTLIRLISTLLKADAGSAKVFGIDVETDEMAVKRLISRVSVDAAFFQKTQPHGEPALWRAPLWRDRSRGTGESLRDPGKTWC